MVIELIVIFWTSVLFAFISDCGMKSFKHIIIYFKYEFLCNWQLQLFTVLPLNMDSLKLE